MKTIVAKCFTKLACILMAVVFIGTSNLAAVQEVQAANVCTSVGGNLKKTVSFEAVTGSGWLFGQYLTLTQNKGTAYNGNYGWGGKTYRVYGAYYVIIRRTKGSGTIPKSFTWKSGSAKIKLGKKSTYKITLTPVTETYNYNSGLKFLRYDKYDFYRNWVSVPYWSIKKTKNVTFCT